MSNLCCRRPKLDTSRSPIVLSLANCPFPQPFFDHCGAAGAWANGTAGGERRPRYSAFLGMRPTTHLFLPLFLRLCSEDSHTRSLRTSSIFHLFLSTPDVSRLPSCRARPALVEGGGGQAVQCGRGGGVVAVHPSPVTDIIMFHPDPPQYMSS